MSRKMITIALVALLAIGAAGTAGCTDFRIWPGQNLTKLDKHVPLDGATRILADVQMGFGDLTLSSNATTATALNGDFTYEPPDLKPNVTYAVAADTGRLMVWQGGGHNALRAESTWDVRLAPGVPTDLSLKLGLGRSDVDLRGVDLKSLSVLTGVGQTTLDLSGARADDLSVRIEEGVGDLTLKLPKNVGVRVSARDQGFGRTLAEGFDHRLDGWVNEAYSRPGPKIEVELVRGVGKATLQLVD